MPCSRCHLGGHNVRTCRDAPPADKGGKGGRRKQCCSACGKTGHNIRTCARKEDARCSPSPPRARKVAPRKEDDKEGLALEMARIRHRVDALEAPRKEDGKEGIRRRIAALEALLRCVE